MTNSNVNHLAVSVTIMGSVAGKMLLLNPPTRSGGHSQFEAEISSINKGFALHLLTKLSTHPTLVTLVYIRG